MYSYFESLPEEKRKRIVEVCMEEFALKGYEKASTNIMIKKAGISKGILFHYFGSKKNLYLYIIDKIIEEFQNKFFQPAAEGSNDVFERLIEWGIRKLKMFYDDPLQYQLIIDAFMDTHESLKGDMEKRYSRLFGDNMALFLKDIDTEKFRKDIDINKAMELLVLSLEALSNKYMKMYGNDVKLGLKHMERILDDYREYMDILKGGIYRDNSI